MCDDPNYGVSDPYSKMKNESRKITWLINAQSNVWQLIVSFAYSYMYM